MTIKIWYVFIVVIYFYVLCFSVAQQSKCPKNYWNSNNGTQCKECKCDEDGSKSKQCNLKTGQCICKTSYFGMHCNECEKYYWGHPKQLCLKCQCYPSGSETLQCNRETGVCICKEGVQGPKCDKCEKAYLGNIPCISCGECYWFWDQAIQNYKSRTSRFLHGIETLKGDSYTKEFELIQSQLDQIEKLVNFEYINMQDLTKQLNNSGMQVDRTEVKLLYMNNLIINTNQLGNNNNKLKQKFQYLQNKTTYLQETYNGEILNLINTEYTTVMTSSNSTTLLQEMIENAEMYCSYTKNSININENRFKKKQNSNKKKFNELENNMVQLNDVIFMLNMLLCDSQDDLCDSVCGGVNCSICEDSSVYKKGIKQILRSTLILSQNTDTILKRKDIWANVTSKLNQSNSTSTDPYFIIETEQLLTMANFILNSLNNLMLDIKEILSTKFTNYDLRKLYTDIMNKNINLESYNNIELQEIIANIVAKFININSVLFLTLKDYIELTENLLKHTNETKLMTQKILKEGKDLYSNIEEKYSIELTYPKSIIPVEYFIIDEIDMSINNISTTFVGITNNLNEFETRMARLKQNLMKDELFANNIFKKNKDTEGEAVIIYNKSNQLYEEFNNLESHLNTLINTVQNLFIESDNAVNRMSEIVNNVNNEVENLEHELNDLMKDIDEYGEKAARVCTSVTLA